MGNKYVAIPEYVGLWHGVKDHYVAELQTRRSCTPSTHRNDEHVTLLHNGIRETNEKFMREHLIVIGYRAEGTVDDPRP